METQDSAQPDLFGASVAVERVRRVYESADRIDALFGKHAVYVASSHLAKVQAQHDGERGHLPSRKTDLFKGETARQRIAIPMLMGSELADQLS